MIFPTTKVLHGVSVIENEKIIDQIAGLSKNCDQNVRQKLPFLWYNNKKALSEI